MEHAVISVRGVGCAALSCTISLRIRKPEETAVAESSGAPPPPWPSAAAAAAAAVASPVAAERTRSFVRSTPSSVCTYFDSRIVLTARLCSNSSTHTVRCMPGTLTWGSARVRIWDEEEGGTVRAGRARSPRARRTSGDEISSAAPPSVEKAGWPPRSGEGEGESHERCPACSNRRCSEMSLAKSGPSAGRQPTGNPE